MNPFMMSNVFFGPMGMMSMSPMCCGGVNMPYYGSSDMLTFMNFPIFRNTASDYLLDPRLAMMQSQQSMMNGGSVFGNNFLPLFNNFPGMSPIAPWWNPNAKPETEEEKKAREEKEAEAKKPEAKKAESLKKSFDNIKKLAESKNLVTLDESIVKKAEEAMKKEKASEQLEAMKEVMALIPDDIIRKSVMADETVVKKLKEAGYNFNYKNNKYSLSQTTIENVKMNQVHDNILSKHDYDAQGLGSFAAAASADTILALVSEWNNTQKEKGILKFIAQNLPTDEGPSSQLTSMIVPQIINALIDKADQYSGSPKIKADRDKLAAAKETLLKKFDKTNLLKVSDAFETLYARLRMQEAVKVRDYIVNNTDFTSLNEAKPDVINNDMVVAETYANLKEEGIANPPAENSLDQIQTVSTVVINDEGVVDDDKQYEDNRQGLVDEVLAKDNKYLTKVGENSNVYQTKDYDGKGNGVKYYTVKDNKLIEVKMKEDGTFEDAADTENVSSKAIKDYDKTMKRIKNLLDTKAIEAVADTNNLFKATGADEYYALVGDKFGKVKTTADSIKLEELTAADLEEFDDDSVKTKEKVEADKKAKEAKEKQDKINNVVAKVSKEKVVWKSVNKQLAELGLEQTGVKGYYKTTAEPTLYFKYDNDPESANYQKIVHIPNVTEVSKNGYYIQNGSKKFCREVETPEESAKELHEILDKTAYRGTAYERTLGAETVKQDLTAIERKFNSLKTYKNCKDIIDFISSYNDEAYHWWCENDPSLSTAIVNNKALTEQKKKEYIKLIAGRVYDVVKAKQITFDNPDDKITLEQIASGKLAVFNYDNSSLTLGSTACELDRIAKLVIEKYKN